MNDKNQKPQFEISQEGYGGEIPIKMPSKTQQNQKSKDSKPANKVDNSIKKPQK